ncbi:MAG: TonB-dependent receptor domain-containing protein, partial [Cyclonatronaceae bacterium]
FSADMENRLRPGLTITNIPLMGDGSVDQRAMNFDGVERVRNEQFENRYSARAGMDVPLGLVKIKFGSSLLYTQSERRYEEATLSTLRRFNLIRFQKLPRSSFDVYGRYYFPDMINTDLAARYVDTSRPDMRLSEDDMFRRSLIRNYETDEMILGGYFMAIANIGPMDVAGGVRAELTRADYTGRNVLFNQFRFFESSVDATSSVEYLDLFPYARIAYSPSDHTNIRLAFTKSLERQGHDVLTPFELIIPADTLRFKGNPDLKPVLSDNIDLGIDHFINGHGYVSLGLFFKRMTNFVMLTEQIVNETEFPFLQPDQDGGLDVNERSYQNIDTNIELMGVTVSWQQHLSFMPGLFRYFSFNTNYTWSYSDKSDKRNPGDFYLQYQSPHVVNAALMYSQNRTSVQVAWHWSAPSLYKKATELQWAPEINQINPVYLDLYEDGWMDLSVNFGFRVSDRFRFWANVQNLLTDDLALYGDSPDAYAYDSIRRNGVKVSAGIKFTY